MTLDEYTKLADDGCPNTPEHVASGGVVVLRPFRGPPIHVEQQLRLERQPALEYRRFDFRPLFMTVVGDADDP